MAGIRSLPSYFKPKRSSQPSGPSQPSGSGVKPSDSHSPKPASKGGPSPLGPELKRADSNPVRLPSNPAPPRPEAEPIQGMMWRPGDDKNSPLDFPEEPFRPGKLSRPKPDANPPKTFPEPGANPQSTSGRKKFLGIPLPFQTKGQRINAGAGEKIAHLKRNAVDLDDLKPELDRPGTGYKEILKQKHPFFDDPRTSDTAKAKALGTLDDHPGFAARKAELRNEKLSVPNGPTASRMMKPGEQKFLANAFRRLDEDIKNKPFHIHGETAITGNKKGEITQFNHTPGNVSNASPGKGDVYHLHTHPPFNEPFTSSASEPDHIVAANFHLRNKTSTYVTNGKDVLHIQPHSLELVKLIPDPRAEKKLGKFPEAFRVPDPQRPPNPFSNHEAPGALKSGGLKNRPWDGER